MILFGEPKSQDGQNLEWQGSVKSISNQIKQQVDIVREEAKLDSDSKNQQLKGFETKIDDFKAHMNQEMMVLNQQKKDIKNIQ